MTGRERQIQRKEELRRKILDAACELFVSEGYRNASIRKIADKINYSVPTIYFYFKDKADLLDALCEETFSKLEHEHRAIIETEQNPRAALEKCMRSFVYFALENKHHFLATFSAEFDHSTDPDLVSRRQLIGMHSFETLRRAVGAYLLSEKENVTAAELDEATQIIAAATHGVTSWIIALPNYPLLNTVKPADLIEKSIDVLLDGIIKPKLNS